MKKNNSHIAVTILRIKLKRLVVSCFFLSFANKLMFYLCGINILLRTNG
ncbi:MAG: hypothetical protein JWP44_2274 [Mucilaginibacter sp.]|nr:hypothetical protein [Mucilaginibacter sp.]